MKNMAKQDIYYENFYKKTNFVNLDNFNTNQIAQNNNKRMLYLN